MTDEELAEHMQQVHEWWPMAPEVARKLHDRDHRQAINGTYRGHRHDDQEEEQGC